MSSEDCDCIGTACEGRCNVCDGGLSICKVCLGAEGTLPTECPGKAMTETQERLVSRKVLDFIDGKWVSSYANQQKS